MIELYDISVRYGDGPLALHPTSLTFRDGEFNVLLGASGAGKSTLLRCLNLLNRPAGGHVRTPDLGVIDGATTLRAHRRGTGMIFQQHQLIARHTALANVLLGRVGYHPSWRSLFPLPRQERRFALGCLDRVGLLERALDRVDRLSGGQQQRVGIARALAQQPRLMLADEPVASLDPASARRVLSVIRDICREDGITAIVSLHQVELAREYADRVVGLAHGRVVFDGAPADLAQDTLAAIYDRSPAIPRFAHNAVAPPINPAFDLATVED